MLKFKPEARVGLLVVLSVAAITIMYWFLGGLTLRAREYRIYGIFENVQRLARDSVVRMAGVEIGRVADIALWRTTKARVEMRIRRDIKIPAGSEFRVTSGGLVGEVCVEIVPARPAGKYIKPGAVIYGRATVTLDELMAQVNELVARLQTSATSLNKVLGDERMIAAIRNTMSNTELASKRAADLMDDLRAIAARNGGSLDAVLANAATASQNFAKLANDLESVMAKGGKQDLQEILKSGNAAAANLRDASEKLRQLVADEQMSADIKATVSNLKQTSENAKALAERLNKVVGVGRKSGERTKLPTSGGKLDLLVNTGLDAYRLDYNLTIPGSKGKFYRLGLFDIGETGKLNLQAGIMKNPITAFRYGLYASKLAVGVDKYLSPRLSLQADLYRPNDPTLELKGVYSLTDELGVMAGTDNVLGDGSLLLGVQYSK